MKGNLVISFCASRVISDSTGDGTGWFSGGFCWLWLGSWLALPWLSPGFGKATPLATHCKAEVIFFRASLVTDFLPFFRYRTDVWGKYSMLRYVWIRS
ncbi:hypothetical protein [Palleronia caenipelagi]|uniref:Uncharacterized protein n=1 Tax=Palleronia caenipelagi TaxID=2489174 RepID=A0A547PUI8_9RHOB|nr:hypothetical protein [Palleronia caenipelagi]TRD17810.1 hypothetical protein FEV53_12660 [Palleronia caenipelagi]